MSFVIKMISKKALLGVTALLVAELLVSLEVSSKDQYAEWKKEFGFEWSPEEDSYRRLIFMKNLAAIEKHNSDPAQTYTMDLNQFAALTDDEFQSYYLNPARAASSRPKVTSQSATVNKEGQDIDWTTKGIVTPVKNQGRCGSCWAFSAVGVLESHSRQNGGNDILSQQQLVDCSRRYGNYGCDGGFNYNGLKYVKDHGSAHEADYPYQAKINPCHKQEGSYKINSVHMTEGCGGILEALQEQVIGVSVDATHWALYRKGIFSKCGTDLNHDVTLVAWKTNEYYKIKNSWGHSWGEQGFIRLAPGNTCGICEDKSPWVE